MINKLKDILYYNNNNITFFEDTHKYYVNGVEKKSVSSLLNYFKTQEEIDHFNSPEFQEFLKPYAIFGSNIHKQSELIDQGMKLNANDYDEKEYTHLKQYKKFISVNLKDYDILVIEMMMYSPSLDVCGTIDRLLVHKETGSIMLADIKTGTTRDSHWHQQLLYKYMLEEQGIKVDEIALICTKLKNKLPTFKGLKDDKRMSLENDIHMFLEDKGVR